jgi:hypothetical protein
LEALCVAKRGVIEPAMGTGSLRGVMSALNAPARKGPAALSGIAAANVTKAKRHRWIIVISQK